MKSILISRIIAGATAALLCAGMVISTSGQAKGPQTRRAASLPDVPGKTPIMVASSKSSDSALQFTYTFPEAQALSTGMTLGSTSLQSIELGNALQSGDEGKPVLPVVPVQFIIPDGYNLKSVVARNGQKESLKGAFRIRHGEASVPLIPGAKPRKATPDAKIYNSDNPYPKKQVEIVTVQKKRGVTIAIVKLHPVVYNPQSGRISWYHSVRLDVCLAKDRSRKGLQPRSRSVLPASLNVENPEVIETYKDGTMAPAGTGSPLGSICDPALSYRYVVITSDAFKNATTDYTLRDLVAHKQSRGISGTIITTESIYANYGGRDNAEKVRNFIIDAYTNWEADFVLLGGDIDIVPMRKLYCDGGDIPSDLYFQCLDGNYNSDNDQYWGETTDGPGGTDVDLMAELNIGRASAETAEEMANFVYKTITYENVPAAAPFLRKALMVGEYLGFGGVSEYATATMEEIRLGSSAHGYTTVGFASSPLFSVDTLYDSPTFYWPETELVTRMSSVAYGIYNHLGHAGADNVMKLGFNNVQTLTNTNPFFIYSQGCSPGNFEVDCIAEHFTTSTRSGAYAVVFNSRYGYGDGNSTNGPSQRFNRQFWDAYFSEYMTCLGELNADSHEDNIWGINSENVRWCFYETNLFGCPQTPMRGRVIGPSLAYISHTTSDAAGGNDDGIINPGETIDLVPSIINVGTDSTAGVIATVSSTDPNVSISSGSAAFGTMYCCGEIKAAPYPIRISLSSSCPTPYTAQLICTVRDNKDSVWTSAFSIPVYTSFQVSGYVRTVVGNNPLAGATVSFTGLLSGSVTTNSEGFYKFGGINGTYRVTAGHPDFLPGDTQTVVVPPNAAGTDFLLKDKPLIAVTPKSFRHMLLPGDTVKSTMTVSNIVGAGNGDLIFSIKTRKVKTLKAAGKPALISATDLSKWTGKNIPAGRESPSTKLHPGVLEPKFFAAVGLRILYATTIIPTDYIDDFVAGLRSLSSVDTVEVLNCEYATPNLAYLEQFDVVVASSGMPWADPVLMGNTLADYVDAGGKVCILNAAFATGGLFALDGRIMTSSYSPFGLASGDIETVSSAAFESHPVTQGVGSISATYFTMITSLQGSGQSLGKYTNGYHLAAYNPGKPIVAVNVLPEDDFWGGDLILFMGNAFDFLSGFGLGITVDPESETLIPGAAAEVTLTFTSTGLFEGYYIRILEISHNASNVPSPLSVPCTLVVDGNRSLSASPTALDFGKVWIRARDTLEFSLVNSGYEATTVSSIISNNPAFSILEPFPQTVPPLDSSIVRVVYAPASPGAQAALFVITSNAEDNPSLIVQATAVGAAGPEIALEPGSLSCTVNSGDSTAAGLTVSNHGGDTLIYTVLVTEGAPSSLPYIGFGELLAGEIDTRAGIPREFDKGGPDAGGYTWIDSREKDGPRFVWTDIAATGRLLSTVSDWRDSYEEVALSFPFEFYGNSFRSCYVSSNGYVTFGKPSSSSWNLALPSSNMPGNLIAAYFKQLYPNFAGNIHFQDFGDRAVIQYSGVSENIDTTESATFQIVLYGNGEIRFFYKNITEYLATMCTVGIQNESSTTGLNIVIDAPYFADSLAVSISRKPSWLAVTPVHDTVAPGASKIVSVKLSSANVFGGTYTRVLNIFHNVPASGSPLSVPCTLRVVGIRRLAATPASAEFNPTWIGRSDTVMITLSNPGNEATLVTALSTDNTSFFTTAGFPLMVPPFGSVSIPVIFAPAAAGSPSATLLVASNAHDNPSIAIPLTGYGVTGPSIEISPSALNFQAQGGGSVVRTLTIVNSGEADLSWRIAGGKSGLFSNEIHDTIEGIQQQSYTSRHDVFCEYWVDGGNMTFLNFGHAAVSVAGLSRSICMAEGNYSYSMNGYSIRVRNDFAENHIYRSIIEPIPGQASRSDVTISYNGHMGSDFDRTTYHDSVLIAGKWIRFFVNQDSYYPRWTARTVFLIVPSKVEHLGRVSYSDLNERISMEAANISLPATVYLIPSYFPLPAIKNWLTKELSLKKSWTSLSSESGTTGSGLSSDIQASFNTTGLAAGIYRDTLTVTHNDPQQATLYVPIEFEVLPYPGRSRIASVGPATLPKAEGSTYRMRNIRIGSALSGNAAGQRFRVILQ